MKRFNDWLAEHITAVVGTMWCFYVFNLLAAPAVVQAAKVGTATAIINAISSNWIQLVLLPAIMVGQNLQTKKHDEHSEKLDAIHKHLGIKKG